MIAALWNFPGTGTGNETSVPWGVLPVVISVFVIIIAAFIWAACFRKRSRRHHRYHRHHRRHHWTLPKEEREKAAVEDSGGFRLFPKRRHRRLRRKRFANPTLAETGGLPPMRSGDSESPNAG